MMIFDISIAAACALNYDNKEDYQKIVFLVWLYTITKLKVMLIMNMVLGAVGAKEENWFYSFIESLDKFDTFGTLFLAVINIVLVFSVFWFTRKMSQSKISVDVNSVSSTLIMFRNRKIKDSGEGILHDKKVYKRLHFSGEGFPRKEAQTISNTIFLKVKNSGELPSTKIKIKLKVKVYKTKMEYKLTEENTSSILEQKRKIHSTHNFKIKIPYMGVNEEQFYDLFDYNGQFREVEIVLVKIKANNHVYFKEGIFDKIFSPAIIKNYIHPKFEERLDEESENQLYGHKDLWSDNAPDIKKRHLFNLNVRNWWQSLISKFRK